MTTLATSVYAKLIFITAQCIKYLYVMAFTCDAKHAGGYKNHKIELVVNGVLKSDYLDPGNKGYKESKGNLWKLSLSKFFKFRGCVRKGDIDNIQIRAASKNGWCIESIVTFAVFNKYAWAQTTANMKSYRWVDTNTGNRAKTFPLSLTNPPDASTCILSLHVMGITSKLPGAGTNDNAHRIELKVKQRSAIIKYLPDNPRDDYWPGKGTLWMLGMRSFFGLTGCIKRSDITGIAIVEGNNDGWNIESILTYAIYTSRRYLLTSVDWDANKWIDGDSRPEDERFQLALV